MASNERRWPWIAQVALMVAPLMLVWTAYGQLPYLGRHLFAGQIFGGDFMDFWTGARLALHGRVGELFDPPLYDRATAAIWGPGLGAISFAYPPVILPLIAWTGLLAYPWALAAWSAAGVAALAAAMQPYARKLWVLAAVLVSPAVLACLTDGQNGLFSGALLLGSIRLLDRRPRLAGLLIGLLIFKPQLGLLIPLALAASGRWRTIAAAAASGCVLIVASLAFGGLEAWRLYLTEAAPHQAWLVTHGRGMMAAMTPSPLMSLVFAGAPWAVAVAVQAAFSLAAAGLVLVWFRGAAKAGRRLTALDAVVLMTAGLLASPYSYTYDMSGLAAALLVASLEQPSRDELAAWRWGVAALWSAPILMTMVGLAGYSFNAPWPPVGLGLVVLGLILTVMAARRSADAPALAGSPVAL
jgi:hypothetical protein